MALSEIEKLERRYAENPQGLTFAPLAEVLRKNGDVNRALELLRPGLELHPNYVPASIVLGRCHLDLGDLPSAETAFSHVLSLDGENVIALKALADIAERLHRFDQAEHWLNQLLAVDRSNDDARGQLERIETARSHTSKVASRSEEPDKEPAKEPAEEPAPEPLAPERPAPIIAEVVEPEPITAEAAPLTLEELESDSPPAGLEVHETEYLEPSVEQIPGLVGTEVDTPSEEFGDEFNVETSEDIILRSSGGQEFQVPDAAQELYAGVPPAEPPPLFGDETRAPWREPAEPVAELEPIPEVTPVAELESHAAPEAITEPEVLATPEPASVPGMVWEPEPARMPESLSVPEPISPPEPISEPEPISQPEPVPAVAQEPSAAPRRPYTAAETHGESVGAFFGRMLAARPPAGAGAPATHSAAVSPSAPPASSGAPTRPAADALSLSSVFGEETSALPPAVPAPAPGGPAGGVSFDEFFSQPGAAPGARASRAPDAKTDDLDQFHAWLQNLKR